MSALPIDGIAITTTSAPVRWSTSSRSSTVPITGSPGTRGRLLRVVVEEADRGEPEGLDPAQVAGQ